MLKDYEFECLFVGDSLANTHNYNPNKLHKCIVTKNCTEIVMRSLKDLITEYENIAVTLIGSPGEHVREVCAHKSFELFKFECIDCCLVASVQAWLRWIKWFILSEDWFCRGSGRSCSLSGSLDPAQYGWDGLFKVFADEGG